MRLINKNQNGTFLTHYGVKGMRWGVRKDRKTTGRKRTVRKKSSSSKSTGKKINEMYYRDLLDLVWSGKDFEIDKSQKLWRVTNEPNVEKGRIYVSGTKNDHEHYTGELDSIGVDSEKDVYSKEYSLDKNLKVAGVKAQSEELYKIFKNPVLRNIETEQDLAKWFYSTKDDSVYITIDVLNKKTEERRRMIKSLTAKGYDAAVDICDLVIGYSDCPLVVLDSEISLGKTVVNKLWDANNGWTEDSER